LILEQAFSSFFLNEIQVNLLVGGDGYVYMKTIHDLEKIDVIYQRIDDDFIDPLVFREDSTLSIAEHDASMAGWQSGDRQCTGLRRR
ncbi:MAG: circularly permuted type 2 ATP-grasp protein, partial [Methylophaga sp.]|nr:circularly permuted type 2 ATP-grasp protein [Methylophaga sp.]